jgi:hypothetical protein
MNIFKKAIFFLLLVVLIFLLPTLNGAAQVVDNSAAGGTLQAKWNKSLDAGMKQNKSFWLAYSVDRLMPGNEYFISSAKMTGRIRTTTVPTFKGSPLGKLIYGKDVKIIKPKQASEKKQVKEVAVLFLFKPGMDKEPAKIRQSNMCLPFESEGNPIYWLGKTDENNSWQLLTGIFPRLTGDKAKRALLSTIGYHSNSKQVIPFLAKVVNSDETDTVRGKAAGELGDQDNPSAIQILLNTAKKDHSLEVRRKAVNALEDLEFPAAVDALIDIAKTANSTYIRQKAINTLGDVGTKNAAEALNSIAFKDGDIDIQRKAVNAFEDLPDNEGVPYLIDIAKTHPKPYIRKKALDCLSDIKDPRAFEAIKAIAKGK